MSFVSRLRVLVVCIALEAGVPSGVPMLPDIAGEWLVKASFDSASVARGMPPHVDLVCTFERQAETLKGNCRPSDGPAGVPVDGKVEGQHVEWHFDIAVERDGKKQRATYSGVLDDAETSMKGTVAIADVRGEFTAGKP